MLVSRYATPESSATTEETSTTGLLSPNMTPLGGSSPTSNFMDTESLAQKILYHAESNLSLGSTLSGLHKCDLCDRRFPRDDALQKHHDRHLQALQAQETVCKWRTSELGRSLQASRPPPAQAVQNNLSSGFDVPAMLSGYASFGTASKQLTGISTQTNYSLSRGPSRAASPNMSEVDKKLLQELSGSVTKSHPETRPSVLSIGANVSSSRPTQGEAMGEHLPNALDLEKTFGPSYSKDEQTMDKNEGKTLDLSRFKVADALKASELGSKPSVNPMDSKLDVSCFKAAVEMVKNMEKSTEVKELDLFKREELPLKSSNATAAKRKVETGFIVKEESSAVGNGLGSFSNPADKSMAAFVDQTFRNWAVISRTPQIPSTTKTASTMPPADSTFPLKDSDFSGQELLSQLLAQSDLPSSPAKKQKLSSEGKTFMEIWKEAASPDRLASKDSELDLELRLGKK